MKRLYISILIAIVSLAVEAQMMEPVHFSSQLKQGKGAEAEIVFSATIDDGWHVYSTDLSSDGPIPATFHADKLEGVELVGKLQPRGHEVKQYDQMFGMELRFFEHQVTFVQRIRFTQPTYNIVCYLEYGACNDSSCLPPTQVDFKKAGQAPDEYRAEGERGLSSTEARPILDGDEPKADEKADSANVDTIAIAASEQGELSGLWQPVIADLQALSDGTDDVANRSLLYILLMGFVGGLLALLTPCVWPIIPMTVSFFLKRNQERAKAVREALVYGVSIVVIYVLLGLAVTLLFGASALNALATNAVFNIFFFLLLVVFAASFFGAFELTLPSSWSTKIDAKADQLTARRSSLTSYLSIFLMAFTLALVSFSCTGPIIGFLLVAVSMQGSIVAPTIGMLGFAVALAIPFALFAMFPSLLKAAPKSGGWMNTVKVTLGFIELAFALKFLSVADLAYGWHILDREVFISLWIVIFGLLGAYLLGWIRLPHDDVSPDGQSRTNVPQLFLAMCSLAFTVYMVPGLWGAPLKAVSAFTPPMYTQDFQLQHTATEARFMDYEQGMAAAKAEGKPVMIDFTGFGCVNCRKMEAAVWTDQQVADLLNKDYVLISLYVDDKTPLAEPIEVVERGQQRTLRTVGDKWSYLQRVKFGANAQPFYVLLDNDGKPLAGSRAYDEDVQEYVSFLKKGLEKYRNK
ncbi:MAG: thioredoxin family protein [Prevotella sp.]|nr:thioredoxin family protein [Prevotella sp.]